MIDDKREGYEYKNEEKHVRCCVTMCREVDVEFQRKHHKRNNKGEYWARPYEHKKPKEHEEPIPQCVCNRGRNKGINTGKNRIMKCCSSVQKRHDVWVDEIERY